MRKAILGTACAVCALAAAPMAQAAVSVRSDSAVSIDDFDNNAEDVTLSFGVLPGAFSYRVTSPQGVIRDEVDDSTVCTQDSPTQVTCQKIPMFPGDTFVPNIYVDLHDGDDRFTTTGPHKNSIGNSSRLHVRTGGGNDEIHADGNESVDGVNCGDGSDTAFMDAIDTFINADGSGFPPGPGEDGCEAVNPGGGDDGGDDGGGGGSTTTPTTPPPTVPPTVPPATPTPALQSGSLKVRGGQTLEGALKSGLKVNLKTTASAKVGAKLTVSKKYAKKLGLGNKAVVVAKGSKTVGPQGGTVNVVFTKKTKRAITSRRRKFKSKLPARLDVTVAGKPAATQNVRLPRRRRFGGV